MIALQWNWISQFLHIEWIYTVDKHAAHQGLSAHIDHMPTNATIYMLNYSDYNIVGSKWQYWQCQRSEWADSSIVNTVKPVLSGHWKVDKSKVLMTNGSLMKVENIAEHSKSSLEHSAILSTCIKR